MTDRQSSKLYIGTAAVWLLYIASLIPLLILSFYNYPSADDINMGIPAHEAFVNTGSIFAAWGQGLYMAWYDYMNWMGYFTSTALMSVPPSVFGEHFYAAGAFILIFALTGATVLFLHAVLCRMTGTDKTTWLFTSALVLFICVQSLPTGMARVEAFYWYCSGANYILTFCLGLCYLSMLIYGATAKRRPLPALIAASILGFLTGGGNYMTALTCAILSVLAIVWPFLPGGAKTKSPVLRRILLPVLFLLIGFLLSCLAPGNAVREEIVTGFGPLKAIGVSLYYTLFFCIREWTRIEHLLLLLALAPVFWRAAPRTGLKYTAPLLVPVLAFGIVSANVTPPLYALSNISAGRLQTLFYMQYIMALVLTEGYLIGWIRMRILGNPETTQDKAASRLTLYYGTLLAAFVITSALSIMAEPDYYTATEAVQQLTDGSAAGYREDNEARLALYLDPSVTDVVVTPYRYHPSLLFYTDLGEEPENWLNNGIARYYHKSSVRMSQNGG